MEQKLRQGFGALIVTILIVSLPLFVRAQEMYESYTGVRQLGMGGAYTAVVNDETALLANPAALGKLRETTFTLLDPEVEGSIADTQIADAGDLPNVINMQGLLDTLNKNKDQHWHQRAQIFPSIVTQNFGIGFNVKNREDAEVISATNIFRFNYVTDYTFVLGYCLRLFDGILKVGFSGRAVDRIEVHKDYASSSTNLSIESQMSEGTGIASDIGIIATAPIALLPALAIVAHDVGNTAYTLKSGVFYSTSSRPLDTIQTVDAGLSISPILSNHVRMQVTAEYHDLLTSGIEQDQLRRLHAGFEFNFGDALFFRAGVNQRYWTAGLELATERFQMQFASYGEEIGIPGQDVPTLGAAATTREDRRFVGKFSIRF